jgi:uncharacterized membrane protein
MASGRIDRGKGVSKFVTNCARTIAFVLVAGVFVSSASNEAWADLKLCNMTKSRIGVVIGYRDTKGWVTEGWWNINANSCSDILKGKLNARYYYIHAEDYVRDGEWAGKAFMCVKNKSFTIRNAEKNCVERGYRKAGFFEVDTTNEDDWTIRLTDPGENGNK